LGSGRAGLMVTLFAAGSQINVQYPDGEGDFASNTVCTRWRKPSPMSLVVWA
jgi:hypothetical protein